jgi:hypothetical protein
MKLSTVLGALSGKSSHFMSPAVVWITAVGCAAGAADFFAGTLAAGFEAFGAVWPEAARPKHSKIEAKTKPRCRAAWARVELLKWVTIISP